MFDYTKKVVICIAFLSMLISCRTSKLKQSTTSQSAKTAEEVLTLMRKNIRPYRFYTAKITGDVETEDLDIKLQIGLWIKKDTYIFSTFKKFNVEAARSYITNDSIFIVNRLERYYQAEHISRIWDMIQIHVSLPQLQDVIVGNQILPATDEIISFERNVNDYLMRFNYKGNEVQYQIDGFSYDVKQVNISSPEYGHISATYDDFRNSGGVKRPFKNIVTLKSLDLNATVQLHLKEIVWDKDSRIQFSIPPRYERYGL